ncbi:32537_t:CDS:2, partial [Gigaspora margarita]
MDSPSAAVSSEIYEQEVDCVEIPKRVWQSNEFDKYMRQDPQDNYQGYEPDEYGSEFNSEEETVPTSSNYYSESSISKQEKYSNNKKKRAAVPLSISYSQLRKQPPDPFLLPKRQKANVQDESVGQSSDTSKSSKVSKFGGSLLRSPAWKWFEEIYIDKIWHGQCNVEMADKKPCDTKIKTGDSTIALWRYLKIVHGYSKTTMQQLNKKQTTITRSFETFLSKLHSITEQAIHDRAITKVVISQNLSFMFTEDKMFKRFAKIVDSHWAVPSRGKVKSLIDEGFEQICSRLRDDLNKAETVSERLKAVQISIQAQHQLNREKSEDNTLVWAQNDIVTHWNSTYNAWVRMLKLKPYIETLASSLTVQQKKNAIADGKRLKAIMITENKWTAVANIISILKPFNDITNYILDSSYPTMSIIYPTMSTLRNALLKEFEDEDDSIDKPTDFNTSLINNRINIFDDKEISDEDEDAEEFESPAVMTDLVKSIKKIMSKLFEKYYKFSDDEILFTTMAINPRCKNFEYEGASLACQDYLKLEYDQMISDEDLESSSNEVTLDLSGSFISTVFIAVQKNLINKNE